MSPYVPVHHIFQSEDHKLCCRHFIGLSSCECNDVINNVGLPFAHIPALFWIASCIANSSFASFTENGCASPALIFYSKFRTVYQCSIVASPLCPYASSWLMQHPACFAKSYNSCSVQVPHWWTGPYDSNVLYPLRRARTGFSWSGEYTANVSPSSQCTDTNVSSRSTGIASFSASWVIRGLWNHGLLWFDRCNRRLCTRYSQKNENHHSSSPKSATTVAPYTKPSMAPINQCQHNSIDI